MLLLLNETANKIAHLPELDIIRLMSITIPASSVGVTVSRHTRLLAELLIRVASPD